MCRNCPEIEGKKYLKKLEEEKEDMNVKYTTNLMC